MARIKPCCSCPRGAELRLRCRLRCTAWAAQSCRSGPPGARPRPTGVNQGNAHAQHPAQRLGQLLQQRQAVRPAQPVVPPATITSAYSRLSRRRPGIRRSQARPSPPPGHAQRLTDEAPWPRSAAPAWAARVGAPRPMGGRRWRQRIVAIRLPPKVGRVQRESPTWGRWSSPRSWP